MKYVAIIFSLMLGLASTSHSESTKPWTIAVVQEWSHFNPITLNLASTEALLHFTVRYLVMRDSTGKITPDLAEEVPSLANKKVKIITVNGKRKVVAEWRIRQQAKWGDGRDVTCGDWWMGWQIGLSPNVSTQEKNMYEKIEKMEWSESQNKHCKVTYKGDEWTFDRDLPLPVPRHLEEPIFEKWKSQREAYDQNSSYVKDPTNPGLYNGPYVVEDFKLGSHVTLKINSHFYGDKPSFEKFVIKHVGDTSALRAQLKTGAVDFVSAVGMPMDTALQLDKEVSDPASSAKFKVHLQPSPIFQGLFMNTENQILKDLQVRKALSLLVNKREITRAFFDDKLAPAESVFSPQSPAHLPELEIYNPKAANLLLDQAGWKLNSNNVREKNGQELAITFGTSSGIKILETVQTYICNQFQKSGIKCIIKNQPPRVFLGSTIGHGEFMLAMFGGPILPDSSLRPYFSSVEIPSTKNGFTGENIARWKSAKADKLVHELDREWSAGKRVKILQALDTEIRAEVPCIPIYHRKEAVVLPKGLTEFTDDVSGTMFTFPERWRL